MKKSLSIIIVSLAALISMAASHKPSKQELYIEKYAPIAVEEMYRSGIPASITLAQGILESGSGQSQLAIKANNHFGIKCHNWKGKGMKFDDDEKDECFRVYKNPEESYRDHSDFLRYRDRYKFLFDYKITDYKSWAYGLKKAGYATDPGYPVKLIKIIEDYKLYEYDKGRKSLAKHDGKTGKKEKGEKEKVKQTWKEKEEKLPMTPNELERPKASEEFRFSLSRPVYETNNVPFIYSEDGDTYSSIAKANGLFYKELLKFNDLTADKTLEPGTVVYLARKKPKAAKHIDKHIVEGEENLYDISQRFAIRLDKLLKLNGFTSDYKPREGDEILLR